MTSSQFSQGIDLTGQVAIVTGGGRGIGRAMAQALAKAGAAVAVVARTEDQLAETVALVEAAGGRAIMFPADVTDQQAVEQMVREVNRKFGLVDLLVNNAGVFGPCGPSWELDSDEWWQCLDVNLRGPFLCAHAVLPSMVRRQRGRIINTASGAGLGPVPYASLYAISKCAIIRLAENLAAETREHGVSVFAIIPGLVRTALTEAVAGSEDDEKWLGQWFSKAFAAGHDIPPERAAELVVFLASGKADVLSGCCIDVRHDDVVEMVRRADEIQENALHRLRLRTLPE